MWSSTINWLFGFAEPAEQEPTVLEESVSLEERKIDWIFVGVLQCHLQNLHRLPER